MNEHSLRQTVPSATGLRVALFSGNYNYTRDGSNNALNKLVQHLLDCGAAVRVYSPISATPAFRPAGDLIAVPSFALPGRREYRVAMGLPRFIGEDVRRFRPNVIHVSAPDWLGRSAQWLAKRLNVPIVASFHTRFEAYADYYRLELLRAWAWRRQSRFYKASDVVLAPNEPIAAHLVEMGVDPAQISIWGRGVDTSIFSPRLRDLDWRREQGFADSEPIVLFLGRLVKEKGLGCFVETIRELRIRGQSVRPLIIGIGPAEAEMKAAIGDAVFTGHLDGPALGKAVASADILANPSITEAFGTVNLEAMAAGLAIVSADVESARTLIEHEQTGLLCTPDPLDLADTIHRLMIDPALRARLGDSAAIEASSKQWPQVLDAVVKAYRGVTSSRHALLGREEPRKSMSDKE